MSEHKVVIEDQATPKLKLLEKAITSSTKYMTELGEAVNKTASEIESLKRAEFEAADLNFNSYIIDFLSGMGRNGFLGAVTNAAKAGATGSFGGPAGTAAGVAGGAISGGLLGMAEFATMNSSNFGKNYDQYIAAKEAYDKAKRPITKAAEAGYFDLKEQEIDLQVQLLGPGRKYYKNLQLNNVRKQLQEIRDEFGVTESQMVDYSYESKSIWDDPHHVLPPSGQTPVYNDDGVIYGTVDPNDPSRATGKIPSSYLNPNTSQTTFGVGFGDDSWDFQGYIDQFNTLRETSRDTSSALRADMDTAVTRGLRPFGDSISNASYKFSNELTPAGDYAFTAFDDGLGGLGTGFGTVDTAAANLFDLTGTGFGNSLAATQNYQENGLDILGLTLGSQLPSQLSIFQGSHDTAFGQMQGVTSSAYTQMGLAAHDFFDDVGFQASHVLGGLVTGEIDSLDDAWETLVNGMGASFDNMLAELTQSLIGWATGSLADLAGAGFQDILAGLFNVGKGGNLRALSHSAQTKTHLTIDRPDALCLAD